MMNEAAQLAETQSLTAVRGEISDPDRGTALCETQTMTEVRTEISDPDRGVALAETQTFTKANGEASDPDAGAFGGEVVWNRGDQRPLLFRTAVVVTAEPTVIEYDEVRDLALDSAGNVIVQSALAVETGTETAVRTESTDSDR